MTQDGQQLGATGLATAGADGPQGWRSALAWITVLFGAAAALGALGLRVWGGETEAAAHIAIPIHEFDGKAAVDVEVKIIKGGDLYEPQAASSGTWRVASAWAGGIIRVYRRNPLRLVYEGRLEPDDNGEVKIRLKRV